MNVIRFKVRFCRAVDGGCQACDYAREMDVRHQAKAKRWFLALAEMGPDLPSEFGRRPRDGVWELRVIIQHHQHRFLCCFWKNIIVVTNAFLKKSPEVPAIEIERSGKAMADWVSGKGWEEL